MEHKNVNNVTDVDLYNGYVWLQKDGKAVSMYYGKKIIWSVVTGVEELKKWHIHTQVLYAMLAAKYDDELGDIAVSQVKISVEPDGVKPFLIAAKYSDSSHAIITKLKMEYERIGTNGSNHDDY